MRRPAPPSRPYGRHAVGLRPSLDPDAYFDASSQDQEARRTNQNNTAVGLDRPPSFRNDLGKRATATYGGQVVQTDMVACRLGFARWPSQLPNDDSSDDNRDDSGPLNYVPYCPKMQVSCLVTAPACSWQCGVVVGCTLEEFDALGSVRRQALSRRFPRLAHDRRS
jgi:hypothetical protein